jgi:predicted O-linked N-acetylglucosamine transferase (SPINDLY family)
LGFPGTSGLSNIDYIIADSYVIPEGGEKHYSEEVYRLPICYQPSDSKRDVALNILKKSALGISDCHFVFCCLNNAPKINEFIASAWVKILKRCPSSVLVLLDDNAWSTDNISRFFVSGGVDKARIVFFPRVEVNQHLERHQVIDLFLDTFPYGAHTTANDAIFSDVPVLTLFGHGFASRVAYSLNMHIDMPELCTDEIDQYIETACRFYSDEKWFKDIKDKLREGKRRYGFSNSERFAHEMEVFWERALAGQ